ncbi:MAG: hypothetical protein AAF358_18965 [Pseudomonadota bacterium]
MFSDLKGVSAAIFAVALAITGSVSGATQVQLVPNPNFSMGSDELVTLGLPVAPCEAPNASQIRLLRPNGSEVPVFANALLSWHFKTDECAGSVRAAKIQFRADMTSGPLTYRFEFSGRNTAQDLSETPISIGTDPSTVAGKAGVDEPRVIAVIDRDYLSASGLIPPYVAAKGDQYDGYTNAQFDNYWRDFSFDSGSAANWLFDRTTTLYKYAMRTGRADAYLEAYRSFRWWYARLNPNGSTSNPDCRGGFDFGGKKCDQKYTYAEPIKMHLALTGDDSQLDLDFVNDIAETAWNTSGFGAQGLKSPYVTLNRNLSERGVGLTLLTQVTAFEITGNAEILGRIGTGIDNIFDHQNTFNPDGLPVDGSLRHSWRGHEGDDPYLGLLSSPAGSGSTSIVLEDVADIGLVDTGAPLRFFRGGVINQNINAVGPATDNGNGTWTINLSESLSASLSEGFKVRWFRADFDVIPSDRAFSPWMIENVTDAMWHSYAVIQDPARLNKIETFFRGAGQAIALWGITPQSLNSGTRSDLEMAYDHTFVNTSSNPRAWQDGCSSTSPVLMYFGSSVAPPVAIADIAGSHSGTDQHLPETILSLALARHFETDPEKSEALLSLIEDVDNWFSSGCVNKIAGRNIPWRAFAWQHRSNAWGTFLWTQEESTIVFRSGFEN